MKLSNLSVIFVIIAIPLVLVLSYYISLQRDTINLQTSYNTKLLESTKEAIEAFEINTVEWNEAYSETEDSKRRDISAAINTFTTSLANNLGVAGTSKEFLLANIPAVAFTLYDGCYIYTPSKVKLTIADENGVTVRMGQNLIDAHLIVGYNESDIEKDKGKLLYKAPDAASSDGIYRIYNGDGTYNDEPFTLDSSKAEETENNQNKHILKPYSAYTEKLKDGWVISYTLDNYATVYGEIDGEYSSKSGYLNLISNDSDEKNVISIPEGNFKHNYNFADGDGTGNLIPENNPLKEIKFSGKEMKPELLTEIIAYKDGTKITTGKFNYVYEAEKDTKIYYDESKGKFFRLNNDLDKIYVETLTEPLYKKCTIPTIIDGKKNFLKVYRSLADNQWYVKDSTGVYIVINKGDLDKEWDELLYDDSIDSNFKDVRYDYSAINYCVEAYVFTNWVNDLGLKYSDGTTLKIEGDNDPENEYSNFTQHKRDIIRSIIVSNLNQAMTLYSNTGVETYRLPMLKETEWEQVLSNVSIITFLQNIPIGLKRYNNYAIATSTLNKEYVDPDEIYLYNPQDTASDTIYHLPYCSKLDTTDKLIGYRSIDYIYKYYENELKKTKYYFRHSDETDRSVNQSCYHCLIQRSLYEKTSEPGVEEQHKLAYYTALARERYLQLESITIEQSDIKVTKSVDKADAQYGEEVVYTITITNNATVNDSINILDYYDGEILKDVTIESYNRTVALTENLGTYFDGTKNKVNVEEGGSIKEYNCMYWKGIDIKPGETITIKIKGVVKGKIGSIAKNTVGIYAYSTEETQLATATASSRIIKKVAKETHTTSGDYNVILVLDSSASIIADMSGIQTAAIKVEDILGKENVKSIAFAQSQRELTDASQYISLGTTIQNGISTNYLGAFGLAEGELDSTKQNYIIFMSDGAPTAGQEDFEDIPVLSQLWNLIASIATGWVECIWEEENVFGLSGLLTPYATFWPCDEISKYTWERIMDTVNDLKSESNIYTVYFNKFGNDRPEFGLKKISTGDGYYYDAANTDELMYHFNEIANSIKGVSVDTTPLTSYDGNITLEQASKITKIKVGETEHDISIFKSKMSIDSSTDIGKLNLNDFPGIFHTAGEITVIY